MQLTDSEKELTRVKNELTLLEKQLNALWWTGFGWGALAGSILTALISFFIVGKFVVSPPLF